MWQNLGRIDVSKGVTSQTHLGWAGFFVGTPSAVGSDPFGKLREAKNDIFFVWRNNEANLDTESVFFCKMKTWKLLMATWHFADVG